MVGICNDCINKLDQRTGIDNASRKHGHHSATEKREIEKRSYRELVGSLIYLANATRPDIAFAASMLSYFCANLDYEH